MLVRIPPERVQVIMSFSFRTFDSDEKQEAAPKDILRYLFEQPLARRLFAPLIWLAFYTILDVNFYLHPTHQNLHIFH